jgi:dolichol-phosphate mannosyltransferase
LIAEGDFFLSQNETLVVVPTYNEVENINALLFQLTRDVGSVDVLVVDDSSPDGTAEIVTRFMKHDARVHLLSRKKKEGLAAAYLAGFTWGLEKGYRAFIEMDADFSHQPSDVLRFLETLKESDVVIGCRYIAGGGISGWGMLRQFISRGGNWYAQTVLSLPFQDLTGGFNGWRREVLEKIEISTIRSKGYAFQVELKCRAFRKGFKITEIPIHFENRRLGKSKMSGKIVWEAAFRVLQMKRSQCG